MTINIEPIEEKPIAAVTFEAVDEFTIRRVKPVKYIEVSSDYDLDFLLEQEIAITQQRDALISAKTAELAEVKELIAQAEAAGVKSRKAEEEANTPAEPV